MSLMVDLDMDTVVVGEPKAIGMGPVSSIVSCRDPHNKMYSVFLVVDSPLDEVE